MAKRFEPRHAVLSLVVLSGLAVAGRRVAADAPQGRFTVTNGGMPTGTVLDTQTGLTWQQAVPATLYTWANAGTYCTNNTGGLPSPPWRLPSLRELQTIVDDSQKNPPAIDQNFFPGTPSEGFWTSSPYAPQAGDAWVVYFYDGSAYNYPVANTFRVRCVR